MSPTVRLMLAFAMGLGVSSSLSAWGLDCGPEFVVERLSLVAQAGPGVVPIYGSIWIAAADGEPTFELCVDDNEIPRDQSFELCGDFDVDEFRGSN